MYQSSSPTSTGTLSATTALSDANGIARTQLTTTQTATVNATAGPAKGEVRVEVSAAPSVIIEALSPATVGVPHPVTVTFPVSGNSSPRQVQSVVVDFGDGTSDTRTNPTGAAAFIHTYQREGGVTISARVTDVAGNTGSSQRAIVVQRSQPSVTLTANPTTVSLSGVANGTTTFTVNASATTGQPSIQSVVVRLQDGTVIYSSSASGSQQFAYRFSATGTYTVTATATDAAGSTGTASTVVTVTP